MDTVFAVLAGLAGAARFAHLHETLVSILYDPSNVGQRTLTDLFGNQTVAVDAGRHFRPVYLGYWQFVEEQLRKFFNTILFQS